MITLYFSGTGNTRYIAKEFSKKMQCKAYSIEEQEDFERLIKEHEIIAFSYPIYGSCVPIVMRDFVKKHKEDLNNKKLIILSTQASFSGDGARVFTNLLRKINYKVVYAEHFNMPNNICNSSLFKFPDPKKINKLIKESEEKLEKTCENIKAGIVKKRGFNIFSRGTGLFSQRLYFQLLEKRAKKDVRIDADCIRCQKCVRICPTKNLELIDNSIIQKGNCTLCYRCVNECPQKAITVFSHSKVKKQYRFMKIDV